MPAADSHGRGRRRDRRPQGVAHEYFRCPAGAGSFVKASKIRRGATVLAGLRGRYEDSATAGAAAEELLVLTSKGNYRRVEFVGAEKARCVQWHTRAGPRDRSGSPCCLLP